MGQLNRYMRQVERLAEQVGRSGGLAGSVGTTDWRSYRSCQACDTMMVVHLNITQTGEATEVVRLVIQ